MLDAVRPRLALALIAAGLLAACTTPVVHPQLSQAVVDARAHRDVPPEGACPKNALNAVSPLFLGFPFGESKLDDTLSRTLNDPIRWLTCHAGVPVVIKPDADSHGTDAEQDALAQHRAEAVRNYLIAHRVPAGRIQILRRNAAAPTGQVFLINAEGRRW